MEEKQDYFSLQQLTASCIDSLSLLANEKTSEKNVKQLLCQLHDRILQSKPSDLDIVLSTIVSHVEQMFIEQEQLDDYTLFLLLLIHLVHGLMRLIPDEAPIDLPSLLPPYFMDWNSAKISPPANLESEKNSDGTNLPLTVVDSTLQLIVFAFPLDESQQICQLDNQTWARIVKVMVISLMDHANVIESTFKPRLIIATKELTFAISCKCFSAIVGLYQPSMDHSRAQLLRYTRPSLTGINMLCEMLMKSRRITTNLSLDGSFSVLSAIWSFIRHYPKQFQSIHSSRQVGEEIPSIKQLLDICLQEKSHYQQTILFPLIVMLMCLCGDSFSASKSSSIFSFVTEQVQNLLEDVDLTLRIPVSRAFVDIYHIATNCLPGHMCKPLVDIISVYENKFIVWLASQAPSLSLTREGAEIIGDFLYFKYLQDCFVSSSTLFQVNDSLAQCAVTTRVITRLLQTVPLEQALEHFCIIYKGNFKYLFDKLSDDICAKEVVSSNKDEIETITMNKFYQKKLPTKWEFFEHERAQYKYAEERVVHGQGIFQREPTPMFAGEEELSLSSVSYNNGTASIGDEFEENSKDRVLSIDCLVALLEMYILEPMFLLSEVNPTDCVCDIFHLHATTTNELLKILSARLLQKLFNEKYGVIWLEREPEIVVRQMNVILERLVSQTKESDRLFRLQLCNQVLSRFNEVIKQIKPINKHTPGNSTRINILSSIESIFVMYLFSQQEHISNLAMQCLKQLANHIELSRMQTVAILNYKLIRSLSQISDANSRFQVLKISTLQTPFSVNLFDDVFRCFKSIYMDKSREEQLLTYTSLLCAISRSEFQLPPFEQSTNFVNISHRDDEAVSSFATVEQFWDMLLDYFIKTDQNTQEKIGESIVSLTPLQLYPAILTKLQSQMIKHKNSPFLTVSLVKQLVHVIHGLITAEGAQEYVGKMKSLDELLIRLIQYASTYISADSIFIKQKFMSIMQTIHEKKIPVFLDTAHMINITRIMLAWTFDLAMNSTVSMEEQNGIVRATNHLFSILSAQTQSFEAISNNRKRGLSIFKQFSRPVEDQLYSGKYKSLKPVDNRQTWRSEVRKAWGSESSSHLPVVPTLSGELILTPPVNRRSDNLLSRNTKQRNASSAPISSIRVTQSTTLEAVLKDSELRGLFKAHCQFECCEENVACFEAILEFKTLGKDQRYSHGKTIVKKWLEENAADELNLNSTQKEEAIRIFQQSPEDPNVFDALIRQVIPLMVDSFGRFREKYQSK